VKKAPVLRNTLASQRVDLDKAMAGLQGLGEDITAMNKELGHLKEAINHVCKQADKQGVELGRCLKQADDNGISIKRWDNVQEDVRMQLDSLGQAHTYQNMRFQEYRSARTLDMQLLLKRLEVLEAPAWYGRAWAWLKARVGR
jgi:hypothetical protein